LQFHKILLLSFESSWGWAIALGGLCLLLKMIEGKIHNKG